MQQLSICFLTILFAFQAIAVDYTSDGSIPFQPQHVSHQLVEQCDLQNSPTGLSSVPTSTIRSRPTSVYRPRSPAAVHHDPLRSLPSDPNDWVRVVTTGPDVEDAHTLSQLARMSGNAYASPGQKNWYDIDPEWNIVCIVTSACMQSLTSPLNNKELSIWLGRSRGWLPWTRLPFT